MPSKINDAPLDLESTDDRIRYLVGGDAAGNFQLLNVERLAELVPTFEKLIDLVGKNNDIVDLLSFEISGTPTEVNFSHNKPSLTEYRNSGNEDVEVRIILLDGDKTS